MTDHTARPRSWAYFAACDPDRAPDADCILELRARVERLEQAQQQPAPSTPAGQGELVRRVLNAMLDVPNNSDVVASSFEARAAILAVADWLVSRGLNESPWVLRQEVER